ncbi:MAG: BON domain-containing protein [bacterium]|nr:BON domain-containing protein [bacterium]
MVAINCVWFSSSRMGLLRWSSLGLLMGVLLSSPIAHAQKPSDSNLERRLETALKRDARLREAELRVHVSEGVVTLQGEVDSYLAKLNAVQIVRRESHVVSVKDLLKVETTTRSDEDLLRDIELRLTLTHGLNPNSLQISVDRGNVLLAGSVASIIQVRQAERIAAEVRGVHSVQNDLMLEPVSAAANVPLSNDELKSAVEWAIARDAYIGNLSIQVAVRNGSVELTGVVPNLYHADLASEEVSQVPGVWSIDNRLVVESQLLLSMLPKTADDAELPQVIQQELAIDPSLDVSKINVAASDGEIRLSGTVASFQQRRSAARLARMVVGVSSVDNQLQVAAANRSDGDIQAEAKFILESDSLLSTQPIEVQVDQGTVVLSGQVGDLASRIHAGRIVGRIRGVRSIANRIEVKWNASVSDELLKSQIESELLANPITNSVASEVRVMVDQGRVTLVGTVTGTAQLIEAGRMARRLPTVRSVENELVIRR